MLVTLPDGYRLFVEEVGAGFPLVVLHGGPGMDHTMFRPWLDPLGDEFRFITTWHATSLGTAAAYVISGGADSTDALMADVQASFETLGDRPRRHRGVAPRQRARAHRERRPHELHGGAGGVSDRRSRFPAPKNLHQIATLRARNAGLY